VEDSKLKNSSPIGTYIGKILLVGEAAGYLVEIPPIFRGALSSLFIFIYVL
jgi:hypothetical protein